MPKRLLQLLLVALTAVVLLAADQPASSRFNTIGHELVCPCGCGQILLECNHVGCPDSDRMIGELRQQLTTGAADTAILNFFTGKYGPTVLAAPIRGGFDLVAWIVPAAVCLLGIGTVIFLIRLWKRRQAALPPATQNTGPPSEEADDLRARIRRETSYE